jgi:hypothetical protein
MIIIISSQAQVTHIGPDFMAAGVGAARKPTIPQNMINSLAVCPKRSRCDGRWNKVFTNFVIAMAAADFIRMFIKIFFIFCALN